jgi:hypothetical protein
LPVSRRCLGDTARDDCAPAGKRALEDRPPPRGSDYCPSCAGFGDPAVRPN